MLARADNQGRWRDYWHRWRRYVFIFVPIVLTAVIAALQGVLSTPGCGPGRTVELIFGFQVGGTPCRKIALTADVPSLALGCTALVAAWLYRQSEDCWSALAADLAAAGILPAGREQMFLPQAGIEQKLRWLIESRVGRGLLGGAVLAGGVLFYTITYNNAFLFHDYAVRQHLGAGTYQEVRKLWWANWSQHPLLATAWITVGSAGVLAGVRDLTGFYVHTLTLKRLRDSEVWQFVSSRGRSRHPWDPLIRVANARVWGVVTFLFTFAVLIYLTRAQRTGGVQNYGLALLAAGVLIATVMMLRAYMHAVREIYEATTLRAAGETIDTAGGDAQLTGIYTLLRKADVEMSASPPALSAFNRVTKAIAGMIAFAGFVASVYQVLAG